MSWIKILPKGRCVFPFCPLNRKEKEIINSAFSASLTSAASVTFLEAGWDFVGETVNGTEDIWWIEEGRDYPRLTWELEASSDIDAEAAGAAR